MAQETRRRGSCAASLRTLQHATKLTSYYATLEQALKADAHRIKQNRRTSKALFEQIKADGFAGSYSRALIPLANGAKKA